MPILRVNRACKYFPCHEELEDCTFCFCPFYPCKNEKLGKYIKVGRKRIWDCTECSWIHKRIVVNRIIKLINQKFNYDGRKKGSQDD